MKKFFNYLCDERPAISFLFAYLVIIIVNGSKTLFLFKIGSGDPFYKLFSFISNNLSELTTAIKPFLSFFSFIGSFYFVILFPALFLLSLFIYGVVVQALLHLLMKNKPKRFSMTLSILFASTGFLYVLKLIPFIGPLLFSGLFVYFIGSNIAKKNLMSTWKGVVISLLPSVVFFVFVISLVFSIIGTASFF